MLTRHKRHLHPEVSGFVGMKNVRATQHLKSGDGEQFHRSGNDLSIVDFSRTVDMAMSHVGALEVYLMHEMTGYRPDDVPAQIDIGADSATGRILQSAMVSTSEPLPKAGFRDDPPTTADFSGVVRGLLDGGALSEAELPLRHASASLTREFREQRLRQRYLDATALQQAFGASRATIFRYSSEDGGVSRCKSPAT